MVGSFVRSNFHDDIQGVTVWPRFYDGRALINPSYTEHLAGVPLEENIQRFNKAKEAGDMSRMVTWA